VVPNQDGVTRSLGEDYRACPTIGLRGRQASAMVTVMTEVLRTCLSGGSGDGTCSFTMTTTREDVEPTVGADRGDSSVGVRDVSPVVTEGGG